MADSEEKVPLAQVCVYELLKRNGLILAPHLIKLLQDLGYFDLRTLATIDNIEDLQKAIIENYGASEEYGALTEDDKKSLLGPKFWKTPDKFKFQPGEKAAILCIKPLCNELLIKLPLVYQTPDLSQESKPS